jgi:uncharacterized protein (TIGR03032 family)
VSATSAAAHELWDRHATDWRAPEQVVTQWADAAAVDRRLLRWQATRGWWSTLADLGISLIVTREYEHLVVALSCPGGQPRVTFMAMPHPSGIVADRGQDVIFIASTRNPNQVYELRPVTGALPRGDRAPADVPGAPLVPVASRFYPGALYIHDLGLINGELHANAVGENAVVRLPPEGGRHRVWWPRCIESADGTPEFGRNHIQLNSIAAGPDIERSFFTASSDRVEFRRPGHRNWPVDRRGVVFSGATREPVARGLTRPHSARLHSSEVWVDDSGYGEVGRIQDGAFSAAARLPGWTRGLCFVGDVAFVGTSRVIPRFRRYAPGLDVAKSVCAVHALDTTSGTILGSFVWPYGNQIFAMDWMHVDRTEGFPLRADRPRTARRLRDLFYSFETSRPKEGS